VETLPKPAVLPTAEETPALPASSQPAASKVKQLRLRSAAYYLPHPEKAHYGGEDAHFVSQAGGGAIGVADGVGGWAESGINPAEYSRTFMRVACAFIEKQDALAIATMSSMDSVDLPSSVSASMDEAVVDPRAALDTAHRYTKVPGSATACVVQLCPERKALLAANLVSYGLSSAALGDPMLQLLNALMNCATK
jgi:protein phosphatase PTC7